jgi:hypothetical protein
MSSWEAWVERPVGLLKERGGAQALEVRVEELALD